jgi:hypothetical protein
LRASFARRLSAGRRSAPAVEQAAGSVGHETRKSGRVSIGIDAGIAASAFRPKADVGGRHLRVRQVPMGDIGTTIQLPDQR